MFLYTLSLVILSITIFLSIEPTDVNKLAVPKILVENVFNGFEMALLTKLCAPKCIITSGKILFSTLSNFSASLISIQNSSISISSKKTLDSLKKISFGATPINLALQIFDNNATSHLPLKPV